MVHFREKGAPRRPDSERDGRTDIRGPRHGPGWGRGEARGGGGDPWGAARPVLRSSIPAGAARQGESGGGSEHIPWRGVPPPTPMIHVSSAQKKQFAGNAFQEKRATKYKSIKHV